MNHPKNSDSWTARDREDQARVEAIVEQERQRLAAKYGLGWLVTRQDDHRPNWARDRLKGAAGD